MSENIVIEGIEKTEEQDVPKVDEKQERKIAHDARIAEYRTLKNIGIWALGLLFGLIVCVGVLFIILKFTPIKKVTDIAGLETEEYLGERVYDKSIIDFLLDVTKNPDHYGVSDLPVITKLLQEASTNGGLNEVVLIDYDKLNNVQFVYGEEEETNFTEELLKCIRISPALFGDDLQELSLFYDKEIESNDSVYALNTANVDENFNPALYYYKDANGNYARAFSDIRIESGKNVVDKYYPDGNTLYYRNVTELSFNELQDTIVDRLNKIEIREILDIFSTSDNAGILYNILGNRTIENLINITANDIYLNDVLNEEESPELFTLLKEVTGKSNTGDELITLADINIFDKGGVAINSLLTYSTNTEFYEIIYEAITILDTYTGNEVSLADRENDPEWYNKIKLGHLMSYGFNYDEEEDDWVVAKGSEARYHTTFSISDIFLDSVVHEPESMLQTILESATGKAYANIKIADISSEEFDINNVKISTIIDSPNIMLQNIIKDATDSADYETVKLGDLSGGNFDIEKVRIHTVFEDYAGDSPIVKTLLERDEIDTITIGNMDSKIDDILLIEIYDCFTTYDGTEGVLRFAEIGDGYKRDDNGEYQLIDGMGIMLLTLYNYDVETGIYTVKPESEQLSLGNLGDKSGELSDSLLNAKIKELKDVGIIPDTVSELLDNKSILEVLSTPTP